MKHWNVPGRTDWMNLGAFAPSVCVGGGEGVRRAGREGGKGGGGGGGGGRDSEGGREKEGGTERD